jgi:AcrR family transcriptional regulator
VTDTLSSALDDVAGCRKRGRPRSVEADEAILEAAIDAFVELGWNGLTIEGVAARAGVGKATIYRRYPSRSDLLFAAARRLAQERDPVPDTGTLRGDLSALIASFAAMMTSTRHGQAIPEMVAATAKNPELNPPYREFLSDRRNAWRTAIGRGVERGELPEGVDHELLVDLLIGPLFYRALVSHEPIEADYRTRLVDTALHAVTAAGGAATA